MAVARTEPIVIPEFPKLVAPYIWEIRKGEFTFTDETEDYYEVTYSSIEDARIALKLYADWL